MTDSGESSIIISGALNSESDKAIGHAFRYYGLVRSMSTDVNHISSNTGYKVKNIQKVKNHLFLKKHDLGNDEPQYFFPDYNIAQSWQRLIDGKNIQPQDYILLKHEYAEQSYMNKGFSQQDAHDMANKKYNYKYALKNRKK